MQRLSFSSNTGSSTIAERNYGCLNIGERREPRGNTSFSINMDLNMTGLLQWGRAILSLFIRHKMLRIKWKRVYARIFECWQRERRIAQLADCGADYRVGRRQPAGNAHWERGDHG